MTTCPYCGIKGRIGEHFVRYQTRDAYYNNTGVYKYRCVECRHTFPARVLNQPRYAFSR